MEPSSCRFRNTAAFRECAPGVLVIKATRDTMRCPSCNHDNRAERRFCAECGAALAALCAACGASNTPIGSPSFNC